MRRTQQPPPDQPRRARRAALRRAAGGAPGGEGGFTSVEAAFAMVVALSGLLGFVATATTAIRSTAVIRERSLALVAAERELEGTVALEEVGLGLGLAAARTFDVPGLDPRPDGTPVGHMAVDPLQQPGLGMIVVRIRWRGAYGDDEVQLATTARF